MKKFTVFIMHEKPNTRTKNLKLYYLIGSLIHPNEAKKAEDRCFDDFIISNFQVSENNLNFAVKYENDFILNYTLTKDNPFSWSGTYSGDKENGVANCFVFESDN